MTERHDRGFFRICVKLHSVDPAGPADDAALFVPIFHEWIREGRFKDLVLFDVADYAHVPESPGIVLVSHETHFAMDRSDERFGILAQRRSPFEGSAVEGIAETVRQVLAIAEALEADPRSSGEVSFDRTRIRIESNDRLHAPNTDEGARAFEAIVREALDRVFPGWDSSALARVANDPRDRLAFDVRLPAVASAREAVTPG